MFPKEAADEILAMLEADLQLLQQVASTKNLADTYHPELKTLHNQHADRLREIVTQHGWPRLAEVGQEVAKASWVILQHGIERPEFMRKMLSVFQVDATLGVDRADIARLEDRIRVFQGQKQIYGTNFDWTEAGELEPTPMEQPEQVDRLREQVGLPPLTDDIARMNRTNAQPPKDWHKKQREAIEWAIQTGWRQA